MPDPSPPSFPDASGRRIQWTEMPGPVRAAIEDRLGSKVVAAHSQPGGFSPGVAARLELTDGGRAFVKAVCGTPNPDSPAIYRREARIAAALPAGVPAPALHWSYDDGEWVVLAFDDIDGRSPELPWRADNLLLTPGGVFVVDWPWAAIGAPWLDLVAMLPSVAMQGGPDPESVWRAHRLGRGVDAAAVDALVAALAGYFVHASSLPPAPGIPTLRAFQAAQGKEAVAWLARRRGWNDVAP